jgi:WD40 repeat protein
LRQAIEQIPFQTAFTIDTRAPIHACAMAPNGYLVLVGARPKDAKLWNITTREHIRTMSGHKDAVTVCAYSPNGKYIVTGSADYTLRFRTKSTTYALEHLKAAINCCAFSPDSTRLISGGADGKLCLWNTANQQQVIILGRTDGAASRVNDCAYSPIAPAIATVWSDRAIMIWDMANEHHPVVTANFQGEQHRAEIHSCRYFPDGQHLVTAASDNTLKIWSIASRHCVATLEGHTAPVRSCAVSSDGKFIISASDDNTVKLWKIESLDAENVPVDCKATLQHTAAVTHCIFSPYRAQDQERYPGFRFILTTTTQGNITLWDRYPALGPMPVFDSTSTTTLFTLFRPG